MTCSALFTSCTTPERSRATVAERLSVMRSSAWSARARSSAMWARISACAFSQVHCLHATSYGTPLSRLRGSARRPAMSGLRVGDLCVSDPMGSRPRTASAAAPVGALHQRNGDRVSPDHAPAPADAVARDSKRCGGAGAVRRRRVAVASQRIERHGHTEDDRRQRARRHAVSLRVHEGPASVSRRINAERIVLFGWGRAILLQLAHPLIAAGVHDHSGFRATPWAAATRLYHTVHAMLALTFGIEADYQRALEGIRAIHRRVNGVLPATAGRYAAGTRYSAEDPDLVLWVHATLLESVPLAYERLVAPITLQERDTYCAEAAPMAIALCAREADVPRTWNDTQRYLDRVRASHTLVVSDQARSLARSVLHPPGGWALGPAPLVNRIVTVGLLPPDLREQYGLQWTARHQRAFDAIVPILRGARHITPDVAALWPEARRSD